MKVDVRKLTDLAVLLTGLGILLFTAAPAAGAITTAHDVTPVYDGTSNPWNVGADLIVGNTADANMVILGDTSMVVNSANGFMGYAAGSTSYVQVSGAGALWDNANNLYVGGTATQAGGAAELRLNGGTVEATQAVIWSTGSLTGNGGTLKANGVTNWGTISPGVNGIGHLNIDGDLIFRPGSVLAVQVNNGSWIHPMAAGYTTGGCDSLSVTGDVTIAGGTVRVVSTETIVGNKVYTIIDANHVTGTFTTLDTALLSVAMIDPNERLGYGTDKVTLSVTANDFDLDISGSKNQRALGVALQDIAEAGGTAITYGLQQLPTMAAVRNAYDQLSGQSRVPLAPITATDSAKFTGMVANRLQAARGTVARDLESLSDSPLLAMAERDGGVGAPGDRSWDSFLWNLGPDTGGAEGWGTWAKLYGLSGDRKAKDGVTGYSYSTFGEVGGIDTQLDDNITGGLTVGHSSGQVDYDSLADETDISTMHAGAYGTYSGDGWYLNGVGIYSYHNIHTERVVDLTGERHEGDFDGREFSAYVEAGLDLQPAPTWLIQPLVGFHYTHLEFDPYAETGYAAALVYEEEYYDSYKGSIGAKLTKELALDDRGRTAILQARGRWIHEFRDTTSYVETHFEDVPRITWELTDAEVDRDCIQLGGGVGVRLTRGLRLFVDYDTSFNSDQTVHVFSGALDYRW